MWRRIARILFTIVLPVFFLWLFVRKIDPHEVARSLQGVGWGWGLLFLAALIQVVHLVLRSARWRIMLGPIKERIGFYNLLSTVSIGYMVTMLVPGRVGEVLRPVLLAQREKISKSGAIATIVLERLIDGLTVIFLLAIYLFFFIPPGDGAAQQAAAKMHGGWGAAVGAFIVLSFPVLWGLVHFRKQAAALLERIYSEAKPGGKAIHSIFHSVVDGFAILKGGRTLIGVALYSLLIWCVIAFSIWFSLLAFDIRIPVAGSLVMLAALVFGIAIPTQGGVGTYEWFGQQALVIFFAVGVSKAAAAVLVMHVFAASPTIIMGLWFTYREGLSFRGLREEATGGGRNGGPAAPASEELAPAAPMAEREAASAEVER